jgi:transcriptional regulator with XRE-family HTH domain
MSRKSMAKLLSVSPSTIWRYETGKSAIPRSLWRIIEWMDLDQWPPEDLTRKK